MQKTVFRIAICRLSQFIRSLGVLAFVVIGPRRGMSAVRKLTMNNEKLNLRVGFHRKHSVPEGGELCLTACVAKRNLRYPMAVNIVLEEGEQHLGLCGLEVLRLYGMTVKPHNLTTVKPHNRKRCSPSSRTGGLVSTCRKFRSLRSLHMRLSIVRPLWGRENTTKSRHTV